MKISEGFLMIAYELEFIPRRRTIFAWVLLSLVTGKMAVNYYKWYVEKHHQNKLRKEKQKVKFEQKGPIKSITDGQKQGDIKGILKMNMSELIDFLKQDEKNYKLVFDVYQQQAQFTDQRLNCIIELVKLDISEVDLSGPFAGLPVSLKDNLLMKGYQSYAGCSYFLKPKENESCVLVQVLQKLGAIPFVRTTVPQTMMTILSSNPIDGNFKNPQNINFLPGGSSSGEGALVGAKASILGFGSDVGGSVRIPAAFCGVVGLKPTVGRISTHGVFKLGISSLVRSVIGPICQDVSSCALAMKIICNSNYMSKLDPEIPYLPFNEENYNKKLLKIGYFTHDDSYHVVPAMSRAVEETIKKLEAKGHTVIKWKPPRSGREWWKLYLRAISIDGGKRLNKLVKCDQMDRSISNGIIYVDTYFKSIFNYFKYKLPNWIVDPDLKIFHQCSMEILNSSQHLALMTEIETFRVDVINEWSRQSLDCVICPAGGFTALPLNTKSFYCPLLSYIFLWNLVNFPAGTVPVTKVISEDIQEMLSQSKFKSTPTQRNISNLQKDTVDLSVSVQCVSLPWKEELCLNLMREVETVSASI